MLVIPAAYFLMQRGAHVPSGHSTGSSAAGTASMSSFAVKYRRSTRSTSATCAVVAALGAPALAVLAFEILLNATAVFNHANVRMPAWLDAGLRLWVVTPDMHRVHHSVAYNETNSNFGFNLPWRDRLFGTYRAQPRAGHA